eukprot:gb/GECH01003489.1/.p1 GENE.gb/GECH01003489.1/~~gb/GECH01003489.1/.p1  ORF type:complete len:829 (+),score=183.01 gb/GECH01003489.1/:1-2487(+)
MISFRFNHWYYIVFISVLLLLIFSGVQAKNKEKEHLDNNHVLALATKYDILTFTAFTSCVAYPQHLFKHVFVPDSSNGTPENNEHPFQHKTSFLLHSSSRGIIRQRTLFHYYYDQMERSLTNIESLKQVDLIKQEWRETKSAIAKLMVQLREMDIVSVLSQWFHSILNPQSIQLVDPSVKELPQKDNEARFFSFPENVDDANGWINYIVAVVLTSLIPVFIAFFLYIGMCSFCIGRVTCCKGGHQTQVGFRKKDRLPFIIAYIVGVVLIWIFILIGIGFNASFHTAATDTTTEVFNTSTQVKGVANNVKSDMRTILDRTYDLLDDAEALAARLGTLGDLFDDVIVVVDEVDSDLRSLETVLITLDGAYFEILEQNQILLEAEADGEINNVPNAARQLLPFLPQLIATREALSEVNSLNESILEYKQQTTRFANNVQSSTADFTSTVSNEANQTVGQGIDYINNFVQYINDVEPTLETTKEGVNTAEKVRLGLLITLFLLVGIIFAAGIICVFLKKPLLIHGTTACGFLSIFWLMFFFSLSMLIYQFSDDMCDQHKDLVERSSSQLGFEQAGNFTLSVFECSGDKTLLDVFGLNTDEFSIADVINNSLSDFQRERDNFQALEPINDALANIRNISEALQAVTFEGYESNYTQFRDANDALRDQNPQSQNVTDAINETEDQINIVLNNLPRAKNLTRQVQSRPDEAENIVNNMKQRVNDVNSDTDNTIDSFRNVGSEVDGVLENAECAWIGAKYDTIIDNVCGDMVVATNLIGWMAGLIALVMTVLFFVTIILSRRIKHDYFDKRSSVRHSAGNQSKQENGVYEMNVPPE